jgi:hypothetical protein
MKLCNKFARALSTAGAINSIAIVYRRKPEIEFCSAIILVRECCEQLPRLATFDRRRGPFISEIYDPDNVIARKYYLLVVSQSQWTISVMYTFKKPSVNVSKNANSAVCRKENSVK